ncbi:MAG TPA: GNAT family N-acetyltransferase [Pyrinomonadaceae bacterium]|jgi:ribosomal protein S18 acetylase RimI-like enzyme|nr:GNAT family N-acetyltransferase [Pyrinomonadaceae bacterium]
MNEDKKPNGIKILDLSPELRMFFEQLNRGWIERYFEMEPLDYLLLQNPETEIIEKGGAVLFAVTTDGEVVGTVALKKADDGVFELAKMAVDEKKRGLGAGKALGLAALERAREMGARSVILYTNSILEPAINLYRKLGFRDVPVTEKGYTRVDVKMEIEFEENSKGNQL